MTYILYIDVLFAVNFFMDLLLLLVVKSVLKYPFYPCRIAGAAAAGAVWACVSAAFLFLPWWLEGTITYILISGIMINMAFGVKRLRELIKGIASLYFGGVFVGGIMYTWYQSPMFVSFQGSLLPAASLVFLAAAGYFGGRLIWSVVEETRREKEHLYQVHLMYGEKEITVTALLDTGNLLQEPVTGEPVHIITEETGKRLFVSQESMTEIPFHTVGSTAGVMMGLHLASMKIENGTQQLFIQSPMVALSQNPISGDGSYEMLLHANYSSIRS